MKRKFRKPFVTLYSLIFMLSIIFLFVSCNNASNAYYSPDKLVIYDRTESLDTIKGVFIDSISGPLGIECLDDYLLILSNTDGKLLSVVDTRSDTIIRQFGNIGHSKTELLYPISMCQLFYSDDNKVNMCIEDVSKKELYLYDFENVLKNGKLYKNNVVRYEVDEFKTPFYRAYSISDDAYMLNTELSTEGDLRDALTIPPCTKLYDGQHVTNYSVYPEAVSTDDYDFLSKIYHTVTRVSPDRKKYVELFTYMNLFTIYDLESQKTIGVSGDKRCFENIETISFLPKDERLKHITIHNLCYNVSKKHIIICQDGNTTFATLDNLEVYEPIVRVFDWNGKLQHSFRIEESLQVIAISDSSHKLYGIDSNFKLYSYDLSKMPLDL